MLPFNDVEKLILVPWKAIKSVSAITPNSSRLKCSALPQAPLENNDGHFAAQIEPINVEKPLDSLLESITAQAGAHVSSPSTS